MKIDLPTPTVQDVRAACETFDRQEKVTEEALEELSRRFPRNDDQATSYSRS
jgi:hypothetical protein